MCLVPCLRASLLLQEREEERSEMLRVRRALDKIKRLGRHPRTHLALDDVEVGDDAVVHEQPPPELERMAVRLGDGCFSAGSADVGEHGEGGRVCADGTEDGINQSLAKDLVYDRSGTGAFTEFAARVRVPIMK